MMKINFKKFNVYTIISILSLLAGIIFYVYWGIRHGVWYDIGTYSLTIVLVLAGIIGIILSMIEETDEQI